LTSTRRRANGAAGISVLERVCSRASGGVVVAWLDRFSRAGVHDALDVVEEIRTHGGRAISLDVADLAPEDPFGEYALTAMLAMSRLQLRRIAERWELCRRDAIGRGVTWVACRTAIARREGDVCASSLERRRP
jgi:DNA invertase Pin-like site-specific DNA recombinase